MMAIQQTKMTWSILALAVAAGTMTSGCDTVAEISFNERNFFNVFSLGPANPGQCEEDDSDVEMRFILRDQKGLVIRYNDRLEKVSAVNETTLTTNEITLSEGLLYGVAPQLLVRCEPDPSADPETEPLKATGVDACVAVGGDRCVAYDPTAENLGGAWDSTDDVYFCRRSCTTDAECSGGTCATADGLQYCQFNTPSNACSSNTDCADGFECLEISGNSTEKLCTLSSTIQATPGSVKYLSPRRVGEDEPLWAVTLLMDNSGSLGGRGVEEEDNSVSIDRATDPGGFRVAAMKQFLALLGDTEKRPWKENMALSLWSFSGESSIGVKPLTGNITDMPVNPFVINTAVVDNALTSLRGSNGFGRSNVFVALETVAENSMALPGTANRNKAVILFTDGPDDSVVINPGASPEEVQAGVGQWNSNLENAISTLQASETQVFIIHLDTGIGPRGMKVLKADPRNAKPYPRDGNGRTGPLAEYGRITCATGGQYMYAEDAQGLLKYLELLVDHLGGTWAVDVGIESLGRPSLEHGPFRLGAVLGVNLGDDGRYFFSPLGNSSARSVGTNDNRPPVFKRQNGLERSNTNLGGSPTNTTLNLPMPTGSQ